MKTQRLKDKPVALKRKKKPKPKTDSQNNYIIPKVQEPVRCPLGESDVRNITKSQCLRPDIYLNNNRNCEGCNFYKNCECKLRCLPKGVDFDGEYFVCSRAKNKKQWTVNAAISQLNKKDSPLSRTRLFALRVLGYTIQWKKWGAYWCLTTKLAERCRLCLNNTILITKNTLRQTGLAL